MALKVWLPLNGVLKNQGTEALGNPSKNTTAFVSGGKLGNLYMTGSYGFHMDREILGNSWTIAVWIKATEAFPTDGASIIFYKNISGSSSDVQLALSIINGTTLNMGFNGSGTNFQKPYTFVVNTWYHIAASYDGNIAKLYVNGELLGSKEQAISQVTGATNIMINGRSNNSSGTSTARSFSGYCFNDVRLYDEALSSLQIKEISKGLMCHLKLDNNGSGLPNLGDFEAIAGNWYIDSASTPYISKADYYDSTFGDTIKITVGNSDTANKRIYKHVYDVWFKDQTYTVSFWAKAETNGVVCNMSRSTSTGNYTENFTLTTEWKKYVGTITSTATTSTGTLAFKIITNDCIVYITQIKLENGDKATAYQPGVEDPHYNLLGYNSNEVTDCSGFGNNFTKVNDVNYDTNSARNTVCTNFTDQSYLVSNQDSDEFLPTEAITVNLWVKFSTFDTPISCTQAGGWSFYPTSGKIRWTIKKNGSYIYYTSTTTIESLQDNKWHMLTGVYDSPNQRFGIYIDGVNEKETLTTESGLIEYISNRLIIAGEAGSGATPESTLYVGGISDVRIYATALSADDIADLYKAAAKIDNNKNFHIYEIVEDQTSTSITKQGQVKISESNETSTMSFDKTNNLKALNLIEF